ncbi:hypothetical protein B0A53_05683 [Rhodotorula sp. CCFEE 5036]|nr:hypothetical protein B0A53_05683 [Rhodotorula sp. CCFEE 5036]
MPYQLCVIGCGTMGVAVLSGVIEGLSHPHHSSSGDNANATTESGPSTPMGSLILDSVHDSASLPNRFIATVNRAESARKLRKTFLQLGGVGPSVQVRQASENVQSVAESDVVLLCCKPQMAAHVLLAPGMAQALEGKLLISILAGTTIAMMREWVPNSCTVVRSMPNTPSKIREGMIVVSSLDPKDPKTPVQRDILMALFTPIGRCRFMDEKHFDAVTAVCGSGPAFVCVVLEAMADGGVMMGLPRSEALELAAQTPGGCTIAGLLALEDARTRSAIARCVQTTAQHAAGLGKTDPSGVSPK